MLNEKNMKLKNDIKVNHGTCKTSMNYRWLLCVATLIIPVTHAATPSEQYHSLKNNLSKLFVPQSNDEYKVAQMQKLSNFSVDSSLGGDLPTVGSGRPQAPNPSAFWQNQRKGIKEAVQIAVERNPDIFPRHLPRWQRRMPILMSQKRAIILNFLVVSVQVIWARKAVVSSC